MFDLPPYPHTHMQAHPIQKLKKAKYSLVPEFALSKLHPVDSESNCLVPVNYTTYYKLA